MDKKKLFLIIGIFWILLIGGLVGIKEFTLQTGTEVLLKTVPVDPRDLFRGDYVILQYEISTISAKATTLNFSDFNVGDKVYIALNVDKDKIGSVNSVNKQAPEKEDFIKGTVKRVYGNSIVVEYNIESYFVPEGRGKEIEEKRGKLYTKVSIDKYGNAVIKSLIIDGKEINFN